MYQVKYKTTIISVVLGFFILTPLYLLLHTSPARAQQARTITLSPPSIQKVLNPGDFIEGAVSIINDSSEPINLNVATHDFVVTDTSGTPTFTSASLSSRFSAASWITVNPELLTLMPHQRQTIDYFIQVPLDASPGGHYASIVFKTTDSIVVNQTGTAVQTQIGTLLYLTVSGDVKESAEIINFSGNWFQEYGPVRLSAEIRNNGDIHLQPQGTITVTNIFGTTQYDQSISKNNIFPGASRVYTISVGKEFMIGRYKASLLGSYGSNNNHPLQATFYFWVIPWKVILIGILILIVLILSLLYIHKKRRLATTDHKPPEVRKY